VAFGGAGGLHATALARRLDMASIAVPPYAGVFSALGLLMAPPRLDAARSVSPTAPYWSHLEGLAKQASTDYLAANGSSPERVERRVDMRYRGQSHEISVAVEPGDSPESLEERFHALHHEMNGFARPDDPVEVVTVRAVAEGASLLGWEDLPRLGEGPLPTPRRRTVTIRGSEVTADVWWRPDLPAGGVLSGPAVIEEDVGTTLL